MIIRTLYVFYLHFYIVNLFDDSLTYIYPMKRILFSLTLLFLVLFIYAKRKTVAPRIPILAWYSIPPGEFATLEHYMGLKEAGFDYSFSHTYTFEDALHALDMCKKVGLKSIVMCPELATQTEQTVRRLMSHPALGGYFLRDEPLNDDLAQLGEWASRISRIDSQHPCYLNLYPIHAFTPDAYARHLRLFSTTVDLPQYSFDHYPIREENSEVSLHPLWYQNLEMILAESQRMGKPFWAFALSTAHTPYPIPTIEHLRLQMYSNLAYGAQLLQYFTYWNPGAERWNFHQAPIVPDGKRSSVYELVREMNQEIQQRAFVWKDCCVEGVWHMGDSIPQGTQHLQTPLPHISKLHVEKGSALLSCITNGVYTYYMFVNTSPIEPLYLNIETDSCVEMIRKDGSSVLASLYSPLHILSPGNVEIFAFRSLE